MTLIEDATRGELYDAAVVVGYHFDDANDRGDTQYGCCSEYISSTSRSCGSALSSGLSAENGPLSGHSLD